MENTLVNEQMKEFFGHRGTEAAKDEGKEKELSKFNRAAVSLSETMRLRGVGHVVDPDASIPALLSNIHIDSTEANRVHASFFKKGDKRAIEVNVMEDLPLDAKSASKPESKFAALIKTKAELMVIANDSKVAEERQLEAKKLISEIDRNFFVTTKYENKSKKVGVAFMTGTTVTTAAMVILSQCGTTTGGYSTPPVGGSTTFEVTETPGPESRPTPTGEAKSGDENVALSFINSAKARQVEGGVDIPENVNREDVDIVTATIKNGIYSKDASLAIYEDPSSHNLFYAGLDQNGRWVQLLSFYDGATGQVQLRSPKDGFVVWMWDAKGVKIGDTNLQFVPNGSMYGSSFLDGIGPSDVINLHINLSPRLKAKLASPANPNPEPTATSEELPPTPTENWSLDKYKNEIFVGTFISERGTEKPLSGIFNKDVSSTYTSSEEIETRLSKDERTNFHTAFMSMNPDFGFTGWLTSAEAKAKVDSGSIILAAEGTDLPDGLIKVTLLAANSAYQKGKRGVYVEFAENNDPAPGGSRLYFDINRYILQEQKVSSDGTTIATSPVLRQPKASRISCSDEQGNTYSAKDLGIVDDDEAWLDKIIKSGCTTLIISAKSTP